MQIIPAAVLFGRCIPELQQKIDWTLGAARTLRAQASQDARAGRLAQAKQLAKNADDFQIIAENILLRAVDWPELGIPPAPTQRGRVS
ncbi:hypothetical protein ACMAUO_06030 [Gluconacetobacter sp. Hr-1-5]|uniref:hypothetical protein n=1 Tax=Gluconacetobacter sp. Hr-1-5 TaxID=3395370 RepID=UPI003B52014E